METMKPANAKTPKRKTHLTEAQLEHFRQKILTQRTEVLDEIERLRQQIGEDSQRAEDDPDRIHHVVEFNHNVASSMIDHEQQVLEALDLALWRIEEGTYGICKATGRPIPLERLEAVPYTELSREAEEQAEGAEGG